MASGASVGDAAGAGGISLAERAKDSEAALACRTRSLAAGGRPPERRQGRCARGHGIPGDGVNGWGSVGGTRLMDFKPDKDVRMAEVLVSDTVCQRDLRVADAAVEVGE